MSMLWHLPILTNNTIHRSTDVSLKNIKIKPLPTLASLGKNDDVFCMC